MKERAAALRAVRAARGLALGVRLLGLELCLRASDDGAGTDTVRALAADLEVTERCVVRWLGELSDAGLFERVDRGAWRVTTPTHQSGSESETGPPTPTVRSGSPRPYVHEDPEPSVMVGTPDHEPPVGVGAPRAPGLREPDPSESSEESETYSKTDQVDLTGEVGCGEENQASEKTEKQNPFSLSISEPEPPKQKSKKPIDLPRPLSPDWAPDAGLVDVLAKLVEASPERILATVPEFVRFWVNEGERKNRNGWERTFRHNVVRLAKRGELHTGRATARLASGSGPKQPNAGVWKAPTEHL